MKKQDIDEFRRFIRFLNRKFKLFSETTWRDFEINHTQSQLLFFINEYGPITSKKLSYEFHMEKSSMSRSIQALVQKKIITAQENKEDQRSKNLFITRKGKKLLKEIDLYGHNRFKELFSKSDERYLTRIYESIINLSFN